jgi:hypothetical protein
MKPEYVSVPLLCGRAVSHVDVDVVEGLEFRRHRDCLCVLRGSLVDGLIKSTRWYPAALSSQQSEGD